MRRWISGEALGIDGLSIEEVFAPEPKDNEILIEVRAASLNFSDLLTIENTHQIHPKRPFTPGQELAGIVIDAPDGSLWKKGSRITSKVDWAGFAEQVIVRSDMAIQIPNNVDFATAATLPVVYTTSMVALAECAVVTPNDWVLVHAAAGGVGLAAVEIAKVMGANVIATASSKEKLATAGHHGADVGINYTDEDWVAQVNDVTKGRGANHIVDPVGGAIGEQSLDCIARDGNLLVVGFASGVASKYEGHKLQLKRAAAKGVYWSHDQDATMLKRINKRLIEMLISEKIRPMVDTEFSFDELPDALRALATRLVQGKLVLRVGADI
jgi:NADPH2:quinone reductase